MMRGTAFAVALVVVFSSACGGSHEAGTSVGPAGGTVRTANVRLDIPAGALQSTVRVSLTETQGPAGTVRRVEIQPGGLALAAHARISMKDDGSPGPFELLHGQDHHALERCCHDDPWHQHSGDLAQLGTVDLAHAAACAGACSAGQVCDDGACRTPDAFCSECGAACGPSGCDGWMCGCNGGACGCPTCCSAGQCCSGNHCCSVGGGMCCGDACVGDAWGGGHF